MTAIQRLNTGRSAQFADSGGGGGVWTLIEKKTLGADTDTIDFSGLNGEFDGYYFLDYTIIKGAAGVVSGTLQPNAITTNQRSELLSWGTATPAATATTANLAVFGSGGAVGEAQRGTLVFWPKTGLPRTGLVEYLESSITSNSAYRIEGVLAWLESATAITSLRIKASVANGFKTGSVLILYKVSS
jgi:hypothetical protein